MMFPMIVVLLSLQNLVIYSTAFGSSGKCALVPPRATSVLRASIGTGTDATTVSAENANKVQPTTTKKWYPNRIQEDVDYSSIVKSLYLRHIVVERKETAQLIMDEYLTSSTNSSPSITSADDSLDPSSSPDPFGTLAMKLSACSASREEGGKIGWIDLEPLQPLSHEDAVPGQEVTKTTSKWSNPLLPKDVWNQLIKLAPKTGDVHLLESSSTQQIHLVRVEELLIEHNPNTEAVDNGFARRVGSFSGQNAVVPRRKLKGKGVMPKVPELMRSLNESDDPNFTKKKKKKYSIQTNGCQMNVADSERLAGILEGHPQLQLEMADKPEQADVVVFNTCSIRDHAEQKLYDLLGPYCARKRDGDELALIVTGCVAQQEGEALLKKIPELDVVLGPQYVPFLANVLEQIEWGHQLVVTAPMLHQEDQSIGGRDDSFMTKPIRGHTVKGFVNVIHGCNEHCTYCVVPATRGMEQSRPMERILQECLEMAEEGYREITLLGQNIDAYGRDMTPRRNFAQLLEFLNTHLPETIRIRYTTSHPRYMSHRAIDAIADLDRVCEGFHVPFQAGGNDVLKRMRRGYTFESYMKIIERIRTKSPDAGIFADVIVGFPGETEEAFQKTLELMDQVKFDNLNTFAYSPRPNTEAALWEEGQVPEDVKKDRLHRVQELAAQHGLERSQRYVDRVVEILVEDRNPRNPNQVMGRTRQGRQVYFDGDIDALRGEYVHVRVTEARTWSLMGEIHKESEA